TLSFAVQLNRSECATVQAIAPDTLILGGQLSAGKGMRYQARLRVLPEGGAVRAEGDHLRVEGAHAVTLLLAAATDYRQQPPAYRGYPYEEACRARIDAASKRSYAALLAAHVADYQRLYQRVSLDLGHTEADAQPVVDTKGAFRYSPPALPRVPARRNGTQPRAAATRFPP
ncbi:MAG TPA: glycoside hydrolase N-terminal domain-containing protein, partial [Armatimonadota bacterium]|nr:glycoside hydrolase N-terminal domain-containing protein [Armatimonadota bacterium]